MNPQMLQAIMQLLSGGGGQTSGVGDPSGLMSQQNLGGMGAGGEFSPQPMSDINQQLQIGGPLGMQNPMQSPMGGPMQSPTIAAGGFNSPLKPGRAGMNANRSNQGWSSFMPDPTSTMNALMSG